MSQDMGIARAVAQWLSERDIPARWGWSGAPRPLGQGVEVIVALGEYAAGQGGFAHYLGEKYDPEGANWQEWYGRKVDVKLKLDLYAPETGREEEMQEMAERLARVLTLECPDGLRVEKLVCGPTRWDREQRRLKREVEADCVAWLTAQGDEEMEFLDFELRGGWRN